MNFATAAVADLVGVKEAMESSLEGQESNATEEYLQILEHD